MTNLQDLSGTKGGPPMIPYTDFRRLLTDVSESPDLETYIAEVGGSVPLDDVADTIRLLNAIWTMAHDGMTIRTIATAADMSMLALSRELGISRRTIGDWAAGLRNPPDWQLPLIAYAAISMII